MHQEVRSPDRLDLVTWESSTSLIGLGVPQEQEKIKTVCATGGLSQLLGESFQWQPPLEILGE